MNPPMDLPQIIRDVSHLEDLLSTPTEAVLQSLRGLEGDFLVLGAAGKMGPSLSRMIVGAFGSLHKSRAT